MGKKEKCGRCFAKINGNKLKPSKEGNIKICFKCYKREREFIPAVYKSPIYKSPSPKVKRKVRPEEPTLGIKPIRQNKATPYLSIYLTKDEKSVLFKKYIQLGLSSEDADIRIKKVTDKLSNLVERLRKQRKNNEEISIRFKEEFAKLASI